MKKYKEIVRLARRITQRGEGSAENTDRRGNRERGWGEGRQKLLLDKSEGGEREREKERERNKKGGGGGGGNIMIGK